MRKALIISPYFPPSNAADIHRIRMSLPFFEEFGWKVEVVTVDPKHSYIVKDSLFAESIKKQNVVIHYVKAFSYKWTSKFGLGSIALRSLWYYWVAVNKILKSQKFDLIYFSTTQFPVCILGAFWKKKFDIPFVIDMQDPWHSTYYLNKPANERPKKYWFSYHLNKFLEPIAMKRVDAIISVSESYIKQLKTRYKHIREIPCKVITFGYYIADFDIVIANYNSIKSVFKKDENTINIVYIGRGGFDMQESIHLLLTAFKKLLEEHFEYANKLRFHFIGTSYAPKGRGLPSFLPLAKELGLTKYINESTDRITFFESIKGLLSADALIIPGSNDTAYTASKIYPYILAKKPLLGIFQQSSSAYNIIANCKAGVVADLNDKRSALLTLKDYFSNLNKPHTINTNWKMFEKYSARNMTAEQCNLFNEI